MEQNCEKLMDNLINNQNFTSQYEVNMSDPSEHLETYTEFLQEERNMVAGGMAAGLVGSPDESLILNRLIGNKMFLADLGQINPNLLSECGKQFSENPDLMALPEELKKGLCGHYLKYLDELIEIGKSINLKALSGHREEPAGNGTSYSSSYSSPPLPGGHSGEAALKSGNGSKSNIFHRKSAKAPKKQLFHASNVQAPKDLFHIKGEDLHKSSIFKKKNFE